MKEKEPIFEYLALIAEFIPAPLYWWDVDSRALGGNKRVVKAIGGSTIQDFIGKTPYEYYPYEIADRIVKHNQEVMRVKQTLSQEEPIKDLTTGETKYFIAIKSPLINSDDNTIGVIGTSVEITAEKEAQHLKNENIRLEAENKLTQVLLEKLAAEAKAEQLRLENEAYLAQKKEQAKILAFVDKIQRDIQSFKIEALTEKIGVKPKISNSDKQIRLTKRELDILYYLSLNKSPKDIAQIITIIENSPVSDSTINAIINKKLYPKFEVFNIGQLVEKAIMLNQIPFLLDNSTA
ncbi:MAG: Sensory box histidine kinase/response regulator [Burkholderiales bacterium]|jgi:DNA-binding NarL/FixJ family response regulator|nr:Sensory box histidine kinase/response regulator [Burkholderiales bacterium]